MRNIMTILHWTLAITVISTLYGQTSGSARIVVHLPSEARLQINGYPTRQTGAVREFETPPLADGKIYTYLLRATWYDNGTTVTVEREVTFRAGEIVRVDFKETSRSGEKRPLRSRDFLFTYATTIGSLKAGQPARIWLPVASSNADQTVEIVRQEIPPGAKAALNSEPKFGNRILYVEAAANAQGEIAIAVTYRVRRWEVRGDKRSRQDSEELARLFLGPDKRVPVGGKALRLIEGKPLPSDQLALAKILYDLVNSHMVYDKKGVGWGQGDADWACDNAYGNCTDFHSLFIALARAQGIPARFEIGFPLPEQRGEGEIAGYHCWAWFQPKGRGWIPVDISEANKLKTTRPDMVEYYFGNLTEDRIGFSLGRDIDLVPRQSGPPLNFFIYPYVEVNGQTLDSQHIQRRFHYRDLP